MDQPLLSDDGPDTRASRRNSMEPNVLALPESNTSVHLSPPGKSKEDYHSDSMLSVNPNVVKSYLQKRPLLPTIKAGRIFNPRKIPRKIPRKVKGKTRRKITSKLQIRGQRFGEDREEQYRVAIYANCEAIDIDALHKSIVAQEAQDSPFQSSGLPQFNVKDKDWNYELLFDVMCMWLPTANGGNPCSFTSQNSEPTVSLEIVGDSTPKTKLAGSFDSAVQVDEDLISETEADDEDDTLDPWKNSSSKDAGEHIMRRRADAFIYSFGCVVLWNFPSEKCERKFIASLNPYSSDRLPAEASDGAEDDMLYYYGAKSGIRNDEIELSSFETGERLAVSFALAQSCLLSIYEWRIEETIGRTEHIPKDLAKTGKIKMTQDEISREVGKLFIERNTINLESDILDTPEFFWENDEWEYVYEKMCKYLDQEKRIEILNRRLDCIGELLDVLNTQIENQHANKLEWIVIWLILIEVVIQVVWNIIIKDLFGQFPSCPTRD